MRSLLVCLLLTGSAFAADVSIGIGIGPSTSSVRVPTGVFSGSDSTATVLVDGAAMLIGFGPVSLQLDVPLAFGGPAQAQVVASSGGAAAYAERMQFALTPGLKARVGLGLLSPWVSFGAGPARFTQAAAGYPSVGSVINASSDRWALALSPAGGVDIRPLPILLFRGEIRSYTYKNPSDLLSGFSAFQPNWRSNLLFLGSVGVRF
jgi:hypothetical protein